LSPVSVQYRAFSGPILHRVVFVFKNVSADERDAEIVFWQPMSSAGHVGGPLWPLRRKTGNLLKYSIYRPLFKTVGRTSMAVLLGESLFESFNQFSALLLRQLVEILLSPFNGGGSGSAAWRRSAATQRAERSPSMRLRLSGSERLPHLSQARQPQPAHGRPAQAQYRHQVS
jgi:hypothetical protein